MSEREKYSKDGPFTDPVVRCDSCHKLLDRKALHVMGCCPHCGTRKVRNVLQLTSEEIEIMQGWNIDSNFIALFETVKLPEGVNV